MKKIEDYIKENGDLDETKLIEDLSAILVPMAFQEEIIQRKMDESKNEEAAFNLMLEYYKKRKRLVEEYIEKIKESEKNNYDNKKMW